MIIGNGNCAGTSLPGTYQTGGAEVLCTCSVRMAWEGSVSCVHQMSNCPGVPSDSTTSIRDRTDGKRSAQATSLSRSNPLTADLGSHNGPAPESQAQAAEGEVTSWRHRHTHWHAAMTAPGVGKARASSSSRDGRSKPTGTGPVTVAEQTAVTGHLPGAPGTARLSAFRRLGQGLLVAAGRGGRCDLRCRRRCPGGSGPLPERRRAACRPPGLHVRTSAAVGRRSGSVRGADHPRFIGVGSDEFRRILNEC